MSVFADGLMRKAKREMKKNFKETGIYETNAERKKRELKNLEEE
jgi:hypothetical protein